MTAVVGVIAALSLGLTACGNTAYTGEGTVVSKQIDKEFKSKAGSKTKRTVTEYEVTVDVPDSDENKKLNVPKEKYDALTEGQKVTVKSGKIL